MKNESVEAQLGKGVQDWLRGFPPGAPTVVVPVFNAFDDMLECIESLLANNPAAIPLLVLDDGSTDERIPESIEPLSRAKGFAYVRKPSNSGFVATVNLAFEWCAPRDVVVVNSDVVVPPAWLERLRAAAYFRSTIATATPLTNHGTILSVPYLNEPVPYLIEGMTTAQVDARIQEASLLLRPIIPSAVGHCIYFKRAALDVVGHFDEVFSPGYGEEVDFSQRAVAAGFCHVAADDLFVFHKGSRSFDLKGQDERRLIQDSHEEIINTRYPWYRPWVERATSDVRSPLALALESARAALLGYRIAIDATRVDGSTTGTQVLILELIRALAIAPDRNAHLTLIIADQAPLEALLGVDQVVDAVIRISDLPSQEQPVFDLIHRPSQIGLAAERAFLQDVARRFIVSHLDCISFSNPSYAKTWAEWERYRSVSATTFAQADGVIFISDDAAEDAGHQGLHIPAGRRCVTYAGVDHLQYSAKAAPPAGSAGFQDLPFLLMLGTNFKHKNRVYALRLLSTLVTEYRWSGHLVFAGPKVACGGSVAEEEWALRHQPEIRSRVHDLDAVDEGGKKWLLENATLLLYPSAYEGFGLVPFEAAAAGTPALTSKTTSLGEVLGDQVIYLDTFDPVAGAGVVWSFLSDPEMARKQVEAINARATQFTWRQVADRTWGFYKQILRMPPRPRQPTPLPTPPPTPPPTPVLTDPHPTVEPVISRSWRERMARGRYILRNEGFQALLKETWQLIRWMLTR